MGRKSAPKTREAFIARLAAKQHGVISVQQLEEAGIGGRARGRRLDQQRLHRVHRGVYAVGHPGLSSEGLWMAAVLACGPEAVLSHLSAAQLWRLLLPPSPAGSAEGLPPVHVSVPGRAGRRPRSGLLVHRPTRLDRRDITRRLGIPTTTASRTLRDVRRLLPQPKFDQALRQAEYLGLPIGADLEPDHTRSELEARFLALLRRHRLPRPEVNIRIGPYVVDFCWPAEHQVVELDGYRAHRTRSAFESDRARDVQLRLLGYEVMRFTWRQVAERPAEIARALRSLL